MKSSFSYILKGFQLTNQNLDIFFIYAALSLSYYLEQLSGHFLMELLSLTSTVISVGFFFSIPALLELKQKKQFGFSEGSHVVGNNLQRLFFPLLLLAIILALLFLLALFILVIFYDLSATQFTSFFQDSIKLPFFILWNSIAFLLSSTPIFFSIENAGLLRSVKKSISIALDRAHIHIMVWILTITTLSTFLSSFWDVNNLWIQMLITVLASYAAILVVASLLIYYQDRLKINS